MVEELSDQADRRLRAALAEATARLRAAGLNQPAREARLLLAFAQGRANGALPDLSGSLPSGFPDLVARRAAREPMALIRGEVGFWTLDLTVSRDTLIPRADSETVIEAALAMLPDRAGVRRILDLGTGTGALLLAALVECPSAWGLGVDRSPGACRLAAANARRNRLDRRATWVCGNWADAVRIRFDLVLCNPPYIRHADLARLMPEVAAHEPASALDGGPDGLAAYRVLARALPALMRSGGTAVLEIGQGQAGDVTDLLQREGLAVVTVRPDLGGVGRAVVAQKVPAETVWRHRAIAV